ncbi:MAG: hypothetical protein ABI145_10625 [Steroidobacteraceae bacterium]
MRNDVVSLTRMLAIVGTLVFAAVLPCSGQTPQGISSFSKMFKSKDTYMGPVATKIAEFKEDSPVGGLAFNADGTRLAVNPTFADPDLHVWDWSTSKRIERVFHNVGPPGVGNAIQYSVDGSLLAVGHERASPQNAFEIIRIWNARDASIRNSINEPTGGASKSIGFTPDGTFFVRTISHAGNPRDNLIIHRVDNWSVAWGLRTFPLVPRSLALSADSRFAAVGGETYPAGPTINTHPQILIVDLSRHEIVRTIDGVFPDHNQVLTLAWSPSGKAIAAGAVVGGTSPGPDAVKIFDPTTGIQTAREPTVRPAYVSGLAFTPDGRYLIEAFIDGHARIWDSQHRSLLQSIPVDDHFHPAVAVSRDSRHVALASGINVSVWAIQ